MQRGRQVLALRPRPPCTLGGDETVAQAAKQMKKANVDASIVLGANGSCAGILTDTDVAKKVLAAGEDPKVLRVREVMTPNPMCVKGTDDAIDALCTMVERKFRHLPVVDATSGKVMGVLDARLCLYDAISRLERYLSSASATLSGAVMRALPTSGLPDSLDSSAAQLVDGMVQKLFAPSLAQVIQEESKAHDSSANVTIDAKATVQEAAKAAVARKGAVLVRDGGKSCAGILTSKDLLFRVVARGLPLDSTVAADVMTPAPDTMDASATVLAALHQLQYGGYRHVPVVDASGEALGVLDVLTLIDTALSHKHAEGPAGLGAPTIGLAERECWRGFWGSAESLAGVPAYQPTDHGSLTSLQTASKPGGGTSDIPSRAADDAAARRSAAPGSTASLEPAVFLFKVCDPRTGQMHRLTHGRHGLRLGALRASVGAKLGEPEGAFSLQYEDDEGDKVQLSTESELEEALRCAHTAGRERLVLHARFGDGGAATAGAAASPAGAKAKSLYSRLWGDLSDHERVFLLGATAAFTTIAVTIGSLARRR